MNLIKLNTQFFLVKFPIIFPVLYGFFLYQFPSFETALITLTILLLAETHFGATWPFFLNKVNYFYIKENKIGLIVIPLIIIFSSIIGFFLINKLFLLIFFAANIFHVTRQSFGVCKLYSKKKTENDFQEIFIYIVNFILFLIGFFRFYFPVINETNILYINLILILFFIFLFFFYLFKFKFSENFLIFITGCLIFSPICFVNNPVHAIIMGVTMHYTQYLYLTYNVCELRKKISNERNNSILLKKISNYLIVVVFYAIFMTIFSAFSKFEQSNIKNLILIPILGQMLHFYLDSQLWKFSVKYNRDNTLFHISKFIK